MTTINNNTLKYNKALDKINQIKGISVLNILNEPMITLKDKILLSKLAS